MKFKLIIAALAISAGHAFAQSQIITTGNNQINTSNPYAADIVIGSDANSGIRHDASIIMFSNQTASRISSTGNLFNFSAWNSNNVNVSLSSILGGSSYFGGNLGVGTSSPSSLLTINSVTSPTMEFQLNGSTKSILTLANGTNNWTVGSATGDIVFRSVGNMLFTADNGASTLFSLKPTGLVGIGTYSPTSKLTVNAGENNAAIEIKGDINYTYNQTTNTHNLPALTYYANQSLQRSNPSSQIVFADRPGTSGYANAARTSDIIFYTAHSYDAASNAYGIYPDMTMTLKSTQDGGYVGIGTSAPDARLTVNGTLHASGALLDLNVPGPDYVFAKDYQLTNLADLKGYLATYHHLPEVPSAEQMKIKGINVAEINMLLLKKVEELTLYVIEKDAEIKKLQTDQRSWKRLKKRSPN